jgi:putative oxidoreductase
MERYLGRFAPQVYAVLRIFTGLCFAMHGSQKVLGWPGGMPAGELPLIAVVAGWMELVGGLLIAIGLFTSVVAFLCSGQMAVAYWMGHALPSGAKWYSPLENQGELAALFSFVFLYIAARGAGIWSVDSLRKKRVSPSPR